MNLVFLSGPQGSGKTTLCEILESPLIISPELKTNTIKLDDEPRERLILKICQRSLENYEYLQFAKKNPDKIILGNRCIYDLLAFNSVYWRRGWINEESKNYFDEISLNLYLEELREPKAIILNPGYDIVARHLEKRWKSKEKKWREEDQEYIKLACESYELFRANPKIYYIDHEIDLEKRNEIKDIRNWIMNE